MLYAHVYVYLQTLTRNDIVCDDIDRCRNRLTLALACALRAFSLYQNCKCISSARRAAGEKGKIPQNGMGGGGSEGRNASYGREEGVEHLVR